MRKKIQLGKGKWREVEEDHCGHLKEWRLRDEDEVSTTYQAYCKECREHKEMFLQVIG